MEGQNTPLTIMDLTIKGQEAQCSPIDEIEPQDKPKQIDRPIPCLQTPKRLKDQARVTQKPHSVTVQFGGQESSTIMTDLTMEYEDAEVSPVMVPESMLAVDKDIFVRNHEGIKPVTDQDRVTQRAKTAAILKRRGYKRVVEGTDKGTSAGKRPRGDIVHNHNPAPKQGCQTTYRLEYLRKYYKSRCRDLLATNPIEAREKENAYRRDLHARKRIEKEGVPQYQNLTPLINLSPKTSNNKWDSKVRVLAKGELRPFHNTRGQGSILDMDLIDQDETTRNIVFWNEDAIHFDRIINTKDTCFVSGAKITESPKKAKHPTFNKFEFKGTRFTQMQKIEDDPSIPHFKFDFTPIDELCNVCGNDFGYGQ